MINPSVMRKIKYSLLFVPAIVFLTLAFCYRTENSGQNGISRMIARALDKYHYEPKDLNDKFSKDLYTLYLKRLDSDKRFFLKSEIDSLSVFEKELDDEVKNDRYDFFNRTNTMFLSKVSRAEKWYKEILDKPFDFKQKEALVYDEDHAEYLKSEVELKEFWRKNIKRQVLERLVSKMQTQEKAEERKDTIIKIKPYDTLELTARKEVLKMHNDWFARIRKEDNRDKISRYINCITEIFDPHTNYLPPADKANFDIRLSGKLEGIGASLQEKDGYLKVAAIVPGSPSYKQGQLKAGDIILKVAQGNSEPVDVTNMKIDDAIQLIRGKKGTEVRLTIRKPDESIVIIPIIRDVVEMEESYAKSSVVELEGQKFGYIYLPSFYLDMNDNNGRSCSQDIANEINKLKLDNVKGIVLDLRDNGGGSLGDVVEIGGMFIKSGPITQVKARNRMPEQLGDPDGRTLWDGPLTIMVNESSASASEILAAAMQDYKRAMIIGTPTFGKGTVQRFVDLDQEYGDPTTKYGSLKVTIQKFYRINGTTTQLNGVSPDVVLPDRYRYVDFGEKESEFALKSDKIAKSDYQETTEWADKIKNAKSSSLKRIAQNSIFNEIELLAKKIEKLNKRTVFTLNIDEYRAELKENEADNKKYEEVMKQIQNLNIANNSTDDRELQSKDENQRKIKADWNKSTAKDIYIREAVSVLKDLSN